MMFRSIGFSTLPSGKPCYRTQARFGNVTEGAPTLVDNPTWSSTDSDESLQNTLSQKYQLVLNQAQKVMNVERGFAYRINLPSLPTKATIQSYLRGKLLSELEQQDQNIKVLMDGVPLSPDTTNSDNKTRDELGDILKQQYGFLDFLVTLLAIANLGKQQGLSIEKKYVENNKMDEASDVELKQEVKRQKTNIQVLSSRYNQIKTHSAPLLNLNS